MTKLILKFIAPSDRYNNRRRYGPIFHRWLPDGEKDSISIKSGNSLIDIRVWFERCGYINQMGWVKFDYKKREIEPNILYRQAKIDAGPLRGKIIIQGLKDAEVEAVNCNEGDDNYIKLGKKIAKIFKENIIPFINTLRHQYGQYWVQELAPWDSSKESLGYYFMGLSTQWTNDNGESWHYFLPEKIMSTASTNATYRSDYHSYLSENDWKSLDNFQPQKNKYNLSYQILLKAHQLRDEGNYKQCYIESVISLELAIGGYIQNRLFRNLYL